MSEPMSTLSPEKLNSSHAHHSIPTTDDTYMDNTWHEPPSSPFMSHIEHENQENVAPPQTPTKGGIAFDDEAPQSVFKISSPLKKSARKERTSPLKTSPMKGLTNTSPMKMSPTKELPDAFSSKNLLDMVSPSKMTNDEFEAALFAESAAGSHGSPIASPTASPSPSPKKSSPIKRISPERPESAMSNRSRRTSSPAKPSRAASIESPQRLPEAPTPRSTTPEIMATPTKRPSSSHMDLDLHEPALRDNEGLTVAMKFEEARNERHQSSSKYYTENEVSVMDGMIMENTEYNPDGPDFTSLDMGMDDTTFSTFSEMPDVDMTKFAAIGRQSPTRNELYDQETPRPVRTQMTPSTVRTQMTPSTVRTHMTPSTIRRTSRTPSPNSYSRRKGEDTTNLLLDFTAQIEAFGARHGTPSHGRTSSNSTIVPNLLSHIQNQRSPAKSSSYVPSTPSQTRQGLINLLDFELPPPPTPRSVPTVTIRELESLKSNFQSQISSLTASLSGKEAQVESLVKAIADAEHRVGEAQENFRDECSARDYAEAQMVDWKKKGEEVQRLLQDVQSEMARTDTERSDLLSRISEFEKRTEDAEMRAAELETRAIEAESRNVDMTTFITPEESDTKENRKIYSEVECQAAIAEKVNEVARDLHSAYKAKHEKKIRALKDNYQKKADERCKELRVQIIRLERQIEEMEKKHDDTFSKVVPGSTNSRDFVSPGKPLRDPEDLRRIEEQRFELETVKSKLAGLMSELESLRNSNHSLLQELEMERVEKADLVHAAEEMLTMCAAQMEEKAAEDVRKSTPIAPPTPKQHSRANSINNKSTPSAPPTSKQHSRTNSINNKRPGSALSSERPNSAMGERKGSMGESHTPQQSGLKKPSGLRAPGGFGFGRKEELSRSTSGSKSRIMSNIERMGGGRTQE